MEQKEKPSERRLFFPPRFRSSNSFELNAAFIILISGSTQPICSFEERVERRSEGPSSLGGHLLEHLGAFLIETRPQSRRLWGKRSSGSAVFFFFSFFLSFFSPSLPDRTARHIINGGGGRERRVSHIPARRPFSTYISVPMSHFMCSGRENALVPRPECGLRGGKKQGLGQSEQRRVVALMVMSSDHRLWSLD